MQLVKGFERKYRVLLSPESKEPCIMYFLPPSSKVQCIADIADTFTMILDFQFRIFGLDLKYFRFYSFSRFCIPLHGKMGTHVYQINYNAIPCDRLNQQNITENKIHS